MKCSVTTIGIALLFAGSAVAGDKSLVIDDKCPAKCCIEDPSWCSIFEKSTIYDNENNCLVQSVAITGRYHGQQTSTSLNYSNPAAGNPSDYGAHYWDNRRFRLGTKVKFLNDFEFYNEWNIADGDGLTRRSFFNNISSMAIKWTPEEDFYVLVGKDKALVSREYSTSSRKILTLERSLISNEVIATDGFVWGARVGFKALGLSHEVGALLNGADRRNGTQNDGPDMLDFDTRGGASYRAKYALDDNTNLHFDYLFTNNSKGTQRGRGNADRLISSAYNHVLSLGSESSWDLGCCERKVGLLTDFIYGIDREASAGNATLFPGNARGAGEDTFGIVILPHMDITDRLELVGRYAYASQTQIHRPEGTAHNQSPIPAFAAIPNLEDAHTLYLGFNYRLCGDNLKLVGGYEYLTADVEGTGNGDVTGDSWGIGIRTFW